MDSPNAADWLSAGSAAAQAIGAVVAIIFTVKLARQGAAREAAADLRDLKREEAAAEREREFEKTSAERILAAERRASDRAAAEQEEIIDTVLELARDVYLSFEVFHESLAAKGGARATFGGPIGITPFASSRLNEITPALRERAKGAKLINAITEVELRSRPYRSPEGENGMARITAVGVRLTGLDSAITALESLRPSRVQASAQVDDEDHLCLSQSTNDQSV